jgi:DNA-binding NarL/FixJ family response regulator
MTAAYRIILADDHALFRQGVRRIIEEIRDFEVVGEVGDGLELLNIFSSANPDLVVLDIAMPGLRGLEAAKEIRTMRAETEILILTMHRESDYVRHAIKAGVKGYLLKEDADTELISAIRTIREGKQFLSPLLFKDAGDAFAWINDESSTGDPTPLTHREREILKLIAEGRSSREVGELLYISYRTVQNHRANIMKKLGLNRTADLVRYAIHKGYTSNYTD